MAREATQMLAEFAATLTYDDIPQRAREHCKNLLMDAIACALAGDRGEETSQLAALAPSLAQSAESSVIGGDRLSLAGATILNGYLVTATTMCDVHHDVIQAVDRLEDFGSVRQTDGFATRDFAYRTPCHGGGRVIDSAPERGVILGQS